MKISRNALIALAVLGALALFFRMLPEPREESAGSPAREPASPERGHVYAIQGVRVFDGESFREDIDVVLAEGRISAVGQDLDVPDGAEVIDGAGRTLLPGFIDGHVHAFGDALERALRFGVTTELDMFSDPGQLAAARERRESLGGQAVADLWSAGILATAPGGHGTQYGMDIPTIESPDEAPSFVDARLAEGSDYIKIVFDDGRGMGGKFNAIDRATLEALVAAAHERDVMAVVHVSDLASARQAVAAGADGLVHVYSDTTADRDFLELARDSGVFVIPTLAVLESVAGTGGGAALAGDGRLAPYLAPAQKQQLQAGFGEGRGPQFIERARRNLRDLFEAGVPIIAGTDAPNPGTAHGVSLHRELVLLTQAGMGNAEALAAATSVPAGRFGLDDRGRIAAGRIADVVLVAGDPSSDIRATRAIERIWKDGRPVSRELPEAADQPVPKAPRDATISRFDGAETPSRFRLSAEFGFGWQVTSDAMRGGRSEADYRLVQPGAAGSSGALAVSGTVREGFAWPWAGVMFFPGRAPMEPVDFSGKSELVFHARGDGGRYTVMLFSGASAQAMPVWLNFEAGREWQEIRLPLEDFKGADPSRLRGIAFTAGPATGGFEFQIDNLAAR